MSRDDVAAITRAAGRCDGVSTVLAVTLGRAPAHDHPGDAFRAVDVAIVATYGQRVGDIADRVREAVRPHAAGSIITVTVDDVVLP